MPEPALWIVTDRHDSANKLRLVVFRLSGDLTVRQQFRFAEASNLRSI